MPVLWSLIISGIAPELRATMGVPQAKASAMTIPKGSSKIEGTIRALALAKKLRFLILESMKPTYSISRSSISGFMDVCQ